MLLYKPRLHRRGFRKRLDKTIETTIKCCVIILSAAPFSWIMTALWYFGLYRNEIHLDPHLEIIATAAWIPLLGILYGLLASAVIGTVFSEYKSMRQAIKAYDVDTFMYLRDEDLSPLVHALMSILGLLVLAGFMLLAYPEPIGGFLLVGSTSFVLSFIFIVICEIDDPLAGIWFIKTIHKEWLPINPREWREEGYTEMREAFRKKIKEKEENKLTIAA